MGVVAIEVDMLAREVRSFVSMYCPNQTLKADNLIVMGWFPKSTQQFLKCLFRN